MENMNIKEELLIKQAQEGYTVCYIESCPLRDHCLRWLVGQHLPNSASTYRCVNPHFEGVAIGLTNRTYYFEYRNGSRLIPPALQEDIRNLFRKSGWTDEVKFDGYVEDYNW